MSDDVGEDIYRLYRPEWVIAHCVYGEEELATAEQLGAQVHEYFDATFRGRVHDEDVRFIAKGEGLLAVAYVMLRLPNLRGEFKNRVDALRHAKDKEWADARVVLRNSMADHALRSYSKIKLADAQ